MNHGLFLMSKKKFTVKLTKDNTKYTHIDRMPILNTNMSKSVYIILGFINIVIFFLLHFYCYESSSSADIIILYFIRDI